MGLLDDAIREHLDLKRRHGATEEELARSEQDALGPPRRVDVPAPLPVPEASVEAEAPEELVAFGEDEAVDEDDPIVARAAGDFAPVEPAEPVYEAEVVAPAPVEAPVPVESPAPASAPDPVASDLAAPPSAPAAPPGSTPAPAPNPAASDPAAPAPPADPDWLDDDTFAAPAPVAAEPGEPDPEGDVASKAADDVLESTPEFLEETPEHDRLWFEQRPPKDFDFDK